MTEGPHRVPVRVPAGQPPHRPNLMLCDVDRTLLKHDHTLLSCVTFAARRLPMPLVLASARSPIGLLRIREAVGAQPVAICFNGAWIGDLTTGAALYDSPLERATALEIWTACSDLGLVPAWFTLSECCARRIDSNTVAARVRVTGDNLRIIDADDDLPGTPQKILVSVPEIRTEDVVHDLSSMLAGRAAVARSGKTLIEIVGPDVNKGRAAQVVAAHFGFDADDVAAAGDSANDREMLAWVGLSIVPENALRDLTDRATVVVPSCDVGGMAVGFDWLAALPRKTRGLYQSMR